MGKEREERDNLTLEKLRKVMESYILQRRKTEEQVLNAYDQIREFYSIELGDYVIIHGSWYERFPGIKPIWLRSSYAIKENELIFIRGTPMRHNTI